MNRSEFEIVSNGSGRVVEEDDKHYKVLLMGDSYIYLPKSDASITPNVARDFYWESWVSAWFHDEVGNYSTFVDVGMNSGYYSVLAARQGVDVIGFEPNPKYHETLALTAESNPDFNIRVIEAAASDSLGRVTLAVPGELEGGASISETFKDEAFNARTFSRPVESFDVASVTLDSELSHIDQDGGILVKIDTEGAEEMVWNGAKEFIEKYRPTFFIEYTPGVYSDGFLDRLLEYGDISAIGFDGSEYFIAPESLESHLDWVMIVIRAKDSN